MKQITFILLLFSAGFLFSCGGSVKEKINDAGGVAGETAGEFFKGVSKGIDEATELKPSFPKSFTDRGIEIGKTTIASTGEGIDNTLNVYVIFKKEFKGTLTSKVLDNKANEIGRTTVDVEGKAGEAKYIDFVFDKRTNIDSDYKISIE